MKGLDLVRRDWCPLSQDTGRYVVDQILSGKSREDIVQAIHEKLRNVAQAVRSFTNTTDATGTSSTPQEADTLDLSAFVITKSLNKNPKDYPDAKGQAHIHVALRMLQNNKPVNIGDHIPYAICAQGADGASPIQRAYHPDEILRSQGQLTIDVEWYLSTQILPPIARLCEPIEGTSMAILSEQLGLDATKYARMSNRNDDNYDDGWGFTPKSAQEDSERFKACNPLMVTCLSCNVNQKFSGVLSEQTGCSGLICQNSQCREDFFGLKSDLDCYGYLSNLVTLATRKHLRQYYECFLVCDDPACRRRTQQQSAAGLRCLGDCHGRMIQEYDAEALHTQLKYFESLFDVSRLESRLNKQLNQPGQNAAQMDNIKAQLQQLQAFPKIHLQILDLLKQHISQSVVKDSAFNWIRPSLFAKVFGSSK